MNAQFGDRSLTVHFIEQKLNETYNSDIYVTGEYYKTFDMNYGFAHFLAKYLEREFPILDTATATEYQDIPEGDSQRPLSKPVSVMNYFLCDNRGGKLHFDDALYKKIYNEFMRVHKTDIPGTYAPRYHGKYMNKKDLPLFTTYDKNSGVYQVKNTIFNMSPWTHKKEICEIDDYIASFLLGQTITPNSSREDIYYVQKLLIGEDNIAREEKGIWNYVRPDGRTLTDIIIDFQQGCVSKYDAVPIVVTGYFDIFTEKVALNNAKNGGGINVVGL